LTLSFSLS
jgi:hypothetical protein